MSASPNTIASLASTLDWLQSLPAVLWLGVTVVLAAGIAILIDLVGVRLFAAWSKRTKLRFDDILAHALRDSLGMFVFVAIVWVALMYLPLGLGTRTSHLVNDVGATFLIFAVALFSARLIRGALHLPAEREERWLPLSLIGSRVAAITVYLLATLIALHQYGIEISPILTTLGIAGLAVALALQDTLSNLFSGIWIQTERAMRPGHYVKLEESKVEGFVGSVGWRTTKIRTLGGNIVELPNKNVANSTITDFFQPDPKMGSGIAVNVGFEHDPDRVVPILLEEVRAAAQGSGLVLEHPEPSARLNGPADKGWEFWVGFWVPYYYNQWDAKGLVYNRIRRRFLRERIRMPLPIQESYIVTDRPDVTESIVSGHDASDGRLTVQQIAAAATDRAPNKPREA